MTPAGDSGLRPEHKYLKHWACVACQSIQPGTGEYPEECWSCGGKEFLRDEIKIPGTANVGTEGSTL